MALAKPVRGLMLAAIVLWCIFLWQMFFRSAPSITAPVVKNGNFDRDPNLDQTGEPEGKLHRTSDKYKTDAKDTDRIAATLLALVRNEEADAMVRSMTDLEKTWNNKFNYPWIFFNDEPFTEEFKKKTKAATKAKVSYEQIPSEHWDMPGWIDDQIYEESAKVLKESGVQYANSTSYHQMCRWNSGMFYKHKALKDMEYYWRVEPDVRFFCDVDYDVFRYMKDNDKTYGFTINLYDDPMSLPTLWPETVKFLADHPDYLHDESAIKWLTDDTVRPDHNKKAQGYSTCHFWSNFEIAKLDFWRSSPYEEYFNHLDRTGGFFYERWGDAPVHSIALGLFEDRKKIHWFRDIGYQHKPFFQCPNSPKCSGCTAGRLTDGEKWLHRDDCRPNWFKYAGMG